ncbi:MIF4G domain protein [Cooperia oncophora]
MPSKSRSGSSDGDVPSPKSSRSRSHSASEKSDVPSPKSDNGVTKSTREKSRSPSPKSKARRRSESPRRSRTRSRSRSPKTDRRGRSRSPKRSYARSRSRTRSRTRSRDRRRRERSSDDKSRRSRRDDRDDRQERDRKRRSRSRNRRESDEESARDKRARREKNDEKAVEEEKAAEPEKPKKEPLDLLRTRTGGAYIPPAKLRMMQDQIKDKSSEQYQRMNWERLKKKIHGLVNKVNTGNLVQVVRGLLQENVIRGKGLLVRSIMQAQAFSPVFSHVYAAFVAVINSKFPHIGELLLRRLIVQFKRIVRRITIKAHEVLALEIMILMMETPTDDSVEVSIAFIKECGSKLLEVSPRALDTIFTRLRGIVQDGDSMNLDKRVQYMIEVVLTIRKDKFKAYPAVLDELDLIDEEDQITHTISLEDAINPENELNVFKLDPEFEKNEQQYDEIRAEIIGDDEDSDEESEDDGIGSGDEGDGQPGLCLLITFEVFFLPFGEMSIVQVKSSLAPASTTGTTEIIDNTEQNLVAFRREVYLTIQSSLDFQEAAHKLLKMHVAKEMENCAICLWIAAVSREHMSASMVFFVKDICRLAEYQMTFEKIACDTYATIHRFDITKLRNMARLISHLLFTDAISWTIFSDVKLTENDTTSSGRIYLKYVFQELCESMGLTKLYERVTDPTLQQAFAGLFPRDNPQNTRFASQTASTARLLGLDLRQFLEKGMKKKKEESVDESSSSSSSSDSSDDSSDSDSDSDDDDDSDSSSSSSSSSDDSDNAKKSKDAKDSVKRRLKETKEPKGASKQIKEEPLSPKDDRRNGREEERMDLDSRNARRKENDKRRSRSTSRRRRDDKSPPRKDEKHRSDRASSTATKDTDRSRNERTGEVRRGRSPRSSRYKEDDKRNENTPPTRARDDGKSRRERRKGSFFES